MQLTTVGKEVLRGARKARELQEAGAGDPTVQDRLRKLKQVERMQRTFRDEFYTRPLPSQIPELQRELDAYLDHYNHRRPHRALGGLAPLEYLARIRGEAVPTESQMC